jgi:hypothetical protein
MQLVQKLCANDKIPVTYSKLFLIKRGCACLAQLPCRRETETEQERPRRIADRRVKIVTSKMSCAQVKERVVKDSPRSKHEGRCDGSSVIYGL